MQTKYTNSVLKGFSMTVCNDDGDTVERNYTVSSSILDLAYNYLEEARISRKSETNEGES